MAENPIFSYTHRDYEGSRQEGISKIPIISRGQWTDLNATDPGVIILDYVHALVDMINYYQDHQALESFITTAKERVNIFRLAKQLSYKIRSSKGATCYVDFTSNILYDYTIKIPKNTAVSTVSGISYLTSEDAYLLPKENTVSILCKQGTLNELVYQGTGISKFSNTPGAANQTVRLVDHNIDIDSIYIVDNLGREWNPIDYISFSTELDRVYQVELNYDDSISIRFGDGQRGIVPKETDTLNIKYIATAASDGNVPANSIVVLEDTILDNKGQYVDFIVNNKKPSTGGTSSQSSQEIRELAPGAIKAQDRAVTLNDFENLARLVAGVADAKAYDINIKPDLCLHHEVKVMITPKYPDSDLSILKSNVYEYLSQRMIPPTNLQVFTPAYISLDIVVTVNKLEIITASRLTYNIEQTINNYFRDRSGAIGEPFYPSDLAAIIRNVEGVRNIVSITPSGIVQPEDLQVLSLNSVSVNVL